MNWAEAVGFLALGLNLVGNWQLTNRDPRGWVVRGLCNVAQLVYACLIGAVSLGASAVVFAGINLVGWWKWRKTVWVDQTNARFAHRVKMVSEGHTKHCGMTKGGAVCNCGRLA